MSSSVHRDSMGNNYRGHSLIDQVETIYADTVSPEQFFTEYVCTRKPVILKSRNAEFLAETFSNKTLTSFIGDMPVEVEDCTSAPFGSIDVGRRKQMLFEKEFVGHLASGNYYMTTQKISERNGLPQDLAPPIVRALIDAGLIPLVVPIAGNLVLESVNIWMGSSTLGTSSGCHHDFHDNLYFLIRGQKTFRLLSPDKAPSTHNMGIVHENGFIAYRPGLRSDGADLIDVLKWKGGAENIDEAEELLLSALLTEESLKRNPNFCTKREAPSSAIGAVIEAGDILYLPCGYFHEVISSNTDDSDGHLAFNYWYHPPTENRFENPYPDTYWKARAKQISRMYEIRACSRIKQHSCKLRVKRRPLFIYGKAKTAMSKVSNK